MGRKGGERGSPPHAVLEQPAVREDSLSPKVHRGLNTAHSKALSGLQTGTSSQATGRSPRSSTNFLNELRAQQDPKPGPKLFLVSTKRRSSIGRPWILFWPSHRFCLFFNSTLLRSTPQNAETSKQSYSGCLTMQRSMQEAAESSADMQSSSTTLKEKAVGQKPHTSNKSSF